MVKIIGKDDKHIHQASCKRCASLLEFTLNEVTYSTTYDYSGDSDAYNYIICPKCEKQVEVDG